MSSRVSNASRSQYSQPQQVVYPQDIESGEEVPPIQQPVKRSTAGSTHSRQSQASRQSSRQSSRQASSRQSSRQSRGRSPLTASDDDDDFVNVANDPVEFDEDVVPVRYPEDMEHVSSTASQSRNKAAPIPSAYQKRPGAQTYSDGEDEWANEQWEEESDARSANADLFSELHRPLEPIENNEGETDEDDWESPDPSQEKEPTELDPVMDEQQQKGDQEKALVSDTPENTKGASNNANLFLMSAAIFFTVSLICSILAIIFRDAKA